MPWSRRLRRSLERPVDVAPLVFFRVAFGTLLAWHLLDYVLYGWVLEVYVNPPLRVPHPGFGWLQRWPGEGMVTHFAVLLAASVALAAGWWTRAASVVLFLGLSYTWLLERTHANNHDYLILLLALLCCALPLDRAGARDLREHPQRRVDQVPAWTLLLLRGQVAVLYLFGAVSKWNADWLLRGEPFGYRVHRFALEQGWSFADSLEAREVWVALSWAGMLFDLGIVPALLWRRTRALAVGACFLFHAANSVLFPIGIFPVLAFCLSLLFLEPRWSRRILRLCPPTSPPRVWVPAPWARRAVLPGLALWFLVQCLLPLRPWLLSDDPSWTERGALYSWRMMISRKECELEYFATAGDPPQPVELEWRDLLSDRQREVVAGDPALIAWFARVLRERLEEAGHREVRVHALARCALNGRPAQYLVDPEVDLSRVEGFDFVLPLREPGETP